MGATSGGGDGMIGTPGIIWAKQRLETLKEVGNGRNICRGFMFAMLKLHLGVAGSRWCSPQISNKRYATKC